MNNNIIVKSKYAIPDIYNNISNLSFPHFILNNFTQKERRNLIALVDGITNKSYTYNELYNITLKFSSGLKKIGICEGECIGLISPNHINYFTAFQAISLIGAYSTTLNPLYTEDEIEYQISFTNASAIITHPICFDKVLNIVNKINPNINIIVIEKNENINTNKNIFYFEDIIDNENIDNININNFYGNGKEYFNQDNFVTLPFSSGTTGIPKGVMLTHKNLITNIIQALPLEGKDLCCDEKNNQCNLLVPLPFFHIYGMIAGMCLPLYCGAKLLFMSSFEPNKYLKIIQDNKVNRTYIVPPIILFLSKHPAVDNYDLSSLKCIMSAAAPLGADIQEICSNRLNCLVKQSWGMTELSPIGSITPDNMITSINNIKGKVGLLLPLTEAKIINLETGEDIEYFNEGELLIRGPQVMKGYLNNIEATNNIITYDGWLKTGDVAKFDENGWLYIVDRTKELIKYKGYQVAPAELEAIIAKIPEVKDVIVIPVYDKDAGEIPRAYVVKQDNIHITEKYIIDYISERVAPHKKLRGGVRFVDSIPKSASGKLLRRKQIEIDRLK